MSLKLRNNWKYNGNDSWSWAAFLDDQGSGEMDKVDHVEYILHPTFRNPIRRVDTKEDGFKLATTSWGTFDLKAFVHFKDGSKKKLTHEIELQENPEAGISQ